MGSDTLQASRRIKVKSGKYLEGGVFCQVRLRARQLGLSYNLAGRKDDPDNYKSKTSCRDGIDIRNVATTKARSKWSTGAWMGYKVRTMGKDVRVSGMEI